MKNNKFKLFPYNIAVNILIAYICYEVCRIAFLLENHEQFGETLTLDSLWKMSRGGLLFDTSAICFTNILYVVLALLPFGYKGNPVLNKITKWVYIIPNISSVIINLMDTVYFSYTQRRVTANVFSEFGNENNLGTILGIEFIGHWYFILLAISLFTLLYIGYRSNVLINQQLSFKWYCIRQSVLLVITVFLMICGMRGSFLTTATRPVTISNALQYVNHPLETNIVLNTPFSIIKTLRNTPTPLPRYFKSQSELDSVYTPLHLPKKNAVVRRKNVVIFIVESFATEFIGAYNKHLDGGKYKGYTPFVDSLLQNSLTFRETFCNTWTSIDAMPAVLTSIPKMCEPFVLTPYSLNKLNGIAGELDKWGYHTAFFHGAENSSMGFHAFSNTAGFQDYYGMTEFNNEPKFGGNKEFDGHWGIWDEPFLQFCSYKMSTFKEPFMASIFTLSSHHPFVIPAKYKGVFKDEGKHLLHKCIKYTDYSLKRFFETASSQPWYNNTIFVITADHASSKTTHEEYKTEIGNFRVPIIIYDPSGELPRGCSHAVAQQIDIMPTILDYLGYDRPYIAFGKNLLDNDTDNDWAFGYSHIPHLVKGDYLLLYDGTDVTGMYNYRKDKLLRKNLKGKLREEADMKRFIEAILQSYEERMRADSVYIK